MNDTGYTINGQPAVAKDFYAVACNPQRHVVVEACAGAGKTWILVARMARAMLEGAAPGSLLAITFTRKAAGEMRGRLFALLAEWAAMDDQALTDALQARGVGRVDADLLTRARALHDQALHALEGVQIATFHGWFASLLQHAPLEVLQSLDLPAHATLQDNDADLRRALWPAFYEHVADHSGLSEALQEGIRVLGMHGMQSALNSVLERQLEFTRAQQAGILLSSVQSVAQRFPAWAHVTDWAKVLEQTPFLQQAGWALLHDMAQAARGAKGRQAHKQVEKMQLALETNNWAGVRGTLLTEKNLPRMAVPGQDSPHYRAMLAWIEEVDQAQHQASCHAHQQRMVQLGDALLRVWRGLKQQQGVIDMNDVERAAERLLGDPDVSGWVQQRLDARIKHVLIDEFQDTNPVQWHAVRAWLEAYAGVGGGEAPSVFVVGDPKQSIYRFRRADARVFVQARQWLQQAHGASWLGCDLTQRCAEPVVQLVNQGIVAHAQGVPDAPEFREHRSARVQSGASAVWRLPLAEAPPRRKPAAGTDEWRDTLREPVPEPEDAAAQREADALAQWLRDMLHTQGWQPADVLVLARQNSRLALLQEALTRHHVAASMTDRTLLRDSPVVTDVAALVQACIPPYPDLALAHALRTPLFGASDAQLAALARAAQPLPADPGCGRWWRALHQPNAGHGLNQGWSAPIKQVAASMTDRTLLRDSPVVTDVAALVQACLPPHPDLALAHALRTPLFGASDAQLAALARAAQPLSADPGCGRWWRALHQPNAEHGLDQDWAAHIKRVAAALQALPPHDAMVAALDGLDAFNAYARSVPASMWPSVQAQLDAVLDTSLQLQEGRWLRPHDWLDYVQSSVIPHQWPTADDAVRLMTIHGAKGLESPVVVLLDTNPSPPRAGQDEVWLDWPLEASAPQRMVFVRQGKKPPLCALDLASQQAAAAAAEDLNLLYVAVTRAQRHVVLSGHEVTKAHNSWYRQLEGLAEPAPAATGLAQDQAEPPDVVAHRLDGAHQWPTMAATVHTPGAADEGGADSVTADDAQRMGQAMHRWLEGLSALAPTEPVAPQTLARVFGLTPTQMEQVQGWVQAMQRGPAAWVWDKARVQQEANEVDVYTSIGWGRIDRLIWDGQTQCWWVLDYKSAAHPAKQQAALAQVRGYMAAVQQWFGGQTVRGALIGSNGNWTEVS